MKLRLLLFLTSTTVLAQTLPLRLDLELAEQLALEHSPLLREAAARELRLRLATDQIRSTTRPRLDATGSASYDGNPSFGGPDGGADNESWRAGLNLSVPIYSFGRIESLLEQADSSARAATRDLQFNRSELRFATRERYLQALLLDHTVRVQEESLLVLERQVLDNETRLEAGRITRLPLLQSRVALENGRTALLRARRDRTLAIEALRRAIGLPYPPGTGPDDVVLQGDWPSIPGSDMSLEEAADIAAAARSDLLRLAEERRSLEAERQVVRYTRRPQFDGFVNAGFENDRFGDEGVRESWIFGVQFVMPLFDGGDRSSRIAQIDARLEELLSREDQLRLQIDTQLREAYTEISLAEALLAASEGLVEQASEALRLATEAQANGRATQLDVSQAELDLTRARLEQQAAQHDLLRARARILFVIGE